MRRAEQDLVAPLALDARQRRGRRPLDARAGERLDRLDAWLRGYVDDGRLPGASVMVSRRGKVAHLFTYGMRDIAAAADRFRRNS